jgi:hypothetical protein
MVVEGAFVSVTAMIVGYSSPFMATREKKNNESQKRKIPKRREEEERCLLFSDPITINNC